MKCSKARKLTSPYIDGELSNREREIFAAHLKECGDCSAEYNETLAVHNSFARSERFKVPYGFSTRVLANIEAKKAGRFHWIPMFSRVAGTAVVLAIIGVGIISGGFLGKSFSLQKVDNLSSSFSLDVFNAAPSDSLGGVYLAMMEEVNEWQ